jgi:glucose-1-phosphate thymidylyltransferase
MKGIILAGGNGTRLFPCTKITNKHMLPVYDKPMIYYPLNSLVSAGIKDILIVTGGDNPGDFLKLLGSGKEFGLKEIHFLYQEGAGGIAEALSLAEDFADNEKIVVILGDNVFETNIKKYIDNFKNQERGAKLFFKKVPDPKRFGIGEFENDKLINIEEKPKKPKSNLAAVGLYMYDNQIFDIIKNLEPSHRGEFEITDVNNFYIKQGTASFETLDGFWSDVGTFETIIKTAEFVKDKNIF